jgi:hypothetical protein
MTVRWIDDINGRERPKADSRTCPIVFPRAAVPLTAFGLTRMFINAWRSFLESG